MCGLQLPDFQAIVSQSSPDFFLDEEIYLGVEEILNNETAGITV